jgi:hypothetical protein
MNLGLERWLGSGGVKVRMDLGASKSMQFTA